jgi:predicted  nucleic acid-binding Zn-ribbon protein
VEVKSKDIDTLKSSVSILMNSLIKQPEGFWDYHYVTNSVAYTMNELKKKLDNIENKDSPFYVDSLSKYKSIVSKFNYAYVNINNGGKAIMQLSIMQAVDELKYLVDKIFYATENVTSIKISQEEYSIYTKEIDNAKKEITETQKELVTADYINNLQLSVNRLHKKSFISEEDVNKLKGDLESLNISTNIIVINNA